MIFKSLNLFFENKYEEIPGKIYQKYLVDNWVKRILNL